MHKIEELSLNAWPSLQTMVYDGWLIRFANGYTKRANSVNPIYGTSNFTERKIKYCEDLYSERGLVPTFKMTSFAEQKNLDEVLEQKGYMTMHHTSVQMLELTDLKQPTHPSVNIAERLTEEWFAAFCRLTQVDVNNIATVKQMLLSIIPQTCFLALYHKQEIIACGMGVLEEGYFGIFNVVTAINHRKQGVGEQLLLHLLKWGKENGANRAYLQVVQNNEAAIKLYMKLGFQTAYQYWFRVKQ
ncbi:GNAT family N-acetyltransferase [Desmospora activa]|uniref:Acetyltransferase (GNAT) family protein n=1 Tax=Desmospora activa DSM 45169 TaxID=1121389 RepID=A0A2T4ZAY5_9BACL|nr:GNAT family N-acetyltransferase [Desmospora activa]PTM59027.1 acetyltransferase (GNAT) family protein [Desmospora activa DSM 45169]